MASAIQGEAFELVDLGQARARRQLRACRDRTWVMMASNQRAFSRLCASGKLYTHKGVRVGRDLLATHVKLLQLDSRILDLRDLYENDGPPEKLQVVARDIEVRLEKVIKQADRCDRAIAALIPRHW